MFTRRPSARVVVALLLFGSIAVALLSARDTGRGGGGSTSADPSAMPHAWTRDRGLADPAVLALVAPTKVGDVVRGWTVISVRPVADHEALLDFERGEQAFCVSIAKKGGPRPAPITTDAYAVGWGYARGTPPPPEPEMKPVAEAIAAVVHANEGKSPSLPGL